MVFRPIWWMTALLALGLCMPAQAQESASTPVASKLRTLLAQHKLDSVAARLPGETDRFVAALYYANSQLLVVSARYPVPALLREQIWNQKYRDVYTALHGSGLREGKFFVLDLAANGFAPFGHEDGQTDVIYENGVTQTTLNGDWESQKLSKTEYQQHLATADARYAKMLEALVNELQTTGGSTPTAVNTAAVPQS